MPRPHISAALLVPVFAACSALPGPPVQYDSEYEATLSVLVGQRSLGGDFDPVDDQLTYGLEMDIRQPGNSIGFEFGFLHSSDEASKDIGGLSDIDFKSTTTEISIGARWSYDDFVKGLVPYVGAGFAIDWVSFEASGGGGSDDDSDFTPGAYAHVGVAWPFSKSFRVGLDFRMLFFTGVDLNEASTDVDYQQLGLTLGYLF